jgi:peptide/nickel transport system substrate-binding protein
VRKLRKLGTTIAVVACTSFALSACGSSGTEGGTLQMAYSSFPDYLDPQLSYTAEGWTPLYVTYIPLLTYQHASGGAGNKVIPGLAKSLPKITNGGKTYTLELRPGLKYSNGQPVKASDFEYAIERVFNLDSGGSSFYTDIVGAAKYQKTKSGGIPGIQTDDKTGKIVINLTKPRGTFNNELGLMFAAPVPRSTPASKDQTPNPPPATGPYVITKSDPGRGWVMEKNPQWDKNNAALLPDLPGGHVDKFNFTIVRNQSTETQGVESGQFDWMFDQPPSDLLQGVESKYEGSQFREEPQPSVYYFWMNNQTAPFNNLKVRQAVNYAIDPAALERIYSAQVTPGQQMIPPGIPGYKKIDLYPHNMAKAKQLMAQANPSDKDITVWTDDESTSSAAGQYYQDVLNQLGFHTDLKIIGADNYFTIIGNLKTPNLDTGWTDWFQDYPHPSDFLDVLMNGENIQSVNNENFSQVDIPSLNKQLDKVATEQLTPANEDKYAAVDKAYMEQAANAPFGFHKWSTFVSSRINLDQVIYSPSFSNDLTSFQLK